MNDFLVKSFIIEDIIIDIKNRQIVCDNQLLPLNAKYFDVLIVINLSSFKGLGYS